MALEVKICGVRTASAVRAAVDAGASFIGFVFYPRSPRAVTPRQAAELARLVPAGIQAVGLFVDPDDAALAEVVEAVPLDLIQLHGAETPDRVRAIRAGFGLPVMKAIRVAGPDDLREVPAYEAVADRLLFDAKPPPGVAMLPGGNGIAFDWSVLAGYRPTLPWMLSGGLDAGNLASAVAATDAPAVDVSSGVERRPGDKDPALIRAFLAAAARLQPPTAAK